MKQTMTGEGERAAADATLLSVMRRMASPLRHDLAGAVLIPALRLQMLRRQLGGAAPDHERLQATVDEVIVALDAVRKAQIGVCGWLEQRDDTPLPLVDALAAAMASFNLPFSARGIRLENRGAVALQSQSLPYPAQPLLLLLLLHAGFFLALDQASAASTLVVSCAADADGARLSWHFEVDQAVTDEEGRLDTDLPPAEFEAACERLNLAGVAALCSTFGARFESGSAHAPAQASVLGSLYLPAVLNILVEAPQ